MEYDQNVLTSNIASEEQSITVLPFGQSSHVQIMGGFETRIDGTFGFVLEFSLQLQDQSSARMGKDFLVPHGIRGVGGTQQKDHVSDKEFGFNGNGCTSIGTKVVLVFSIQMERGEFEGGKGGWWVVAACVGGGGDCVAVVVLFKRGFLECG